jgi:putative tricarboxylic transport membrane protein
MRIVAAVLANEGLILTAIGIVGLVEGLRLNRISAAAEEAYGPGWYLLLLSLILIVCGFSYLASTFKKRADRKAEASPFRFGPASFCILAMMGYTVLLPYLGYLIGTAAFVFVATRLFGEQSWVKSTLIAGISGAAFWLVFIYLAEIPMP